MRFRKMRSRIVQCLGEAQRNSWGGVSEIVDREAGHSRRARGRGPGAAERSRCRRSQSWTTARRRRVPARAARALQASAPLSRRTRCRPTGRRSRAKPPIVPPEGADDLVSRAQWRWAIGESGGGARRGGRLLRLPPGTNARRPRGRPRSAPPPDRAPRPNAVAGDGKKRDGKKNGDEDAPRPARRSPPRKTPNRDEPRRPQSRASR